MNQGKLRVNLNNRGELNNLRIDDINHLTRYYLLELSLTLQLLTIILN